MPVYFDIQDPVPIHDADALRDVVQMVVNDENDMNVNQLPDPIVLQPGDAAYFIGRKKDLEAYNAFFWSQHQITTSDQVGLGCVAILEKHHIWRGARAAGFGAARVLSSVRKYLPGRTPGAGNTADDVGVRNVLGGTDRARWHGPRAGRARELAQSGKRLISKGLKTIFNEAVILQVFHTDTADSGPVGGPADFRLCGHTITFGALMVYCSVWKTRT